MINSVKIFIRSRLLPIAKRIVYGKSGSGGLTKEDLLDNFFKIIIEIGFSPKHIVDVGANHGTWTRNALNYFPNAHYTLLEPQGNLKKSINDVLISNSKVKFYAMGAGSSSGTLKFSMVGRDDSCTFAMSESEAQEKGYTQIDVPVVTLNGFLPTLNLPNPEVIKIDAEGFDLEVLKGASNYLPTAEVILVEAGIVNKSLDNDIFAVQKFMDTNGFRLFEITDLNRPMSKPVLWLAELAFVRKGGIIDSASFNSLS